MLNKKICILTGGSILEVWTQSNTRISICLLCLFIYLMFSVIVFPGCGTHTVQTAQIIFSWECILTLSTPPPHPVSLGTQSLHLTVSSAHCCFAYHYFHPLSNMHAFNLLFLSLCLFPLFLRYQSYFSLAWQGRDWWGGEVIEFLSQSDSHQHRQFRHSQARRNRQGGHRVDLEPQLTTQGHRRLKPERRNWEKEMWWHSPQFYSPCIHGSKTWYVIRTAAP